MSIDGNRAFALLQRIGFERIGGTEEELHAAHILMDTIAETGAAPVLEPFTISDEHITTVSLAITAPYKKEYPVTGYKGAASGTITGPVVYIGEVNDVSLHDVRGKITMINGALRPGMYEKLCAAGATGIIAMSGTLLDTPDTSDLPTRKLRTSLPEEQRIPAVSLRMTDAFEIIQRGAKEASLTLACETSLATSHNVSVTIPGTLHPEEMLVIGAHYDCVEFSHGVYDNGSGCCIIMELLHHFLQKPPARTLRFIWFGSEELGLLGSKAYLETHKEEIASMRLMLNVDLGAVLLGREWIGVNADPDAAAYLRYLSREMGFSADIFCGRLSTDTNSFVDQGIPAIGFGRDGIPGAEFMHTRYDCIEFQSAAVMENTANFMQTFIERISNAHVFPIPREIPTASNS